MAEGQRKGRLRRGNRCPGTGGTAAAGPHGGSYLCLGTVPRRLPRHAGTIAVVVLLGSVLFCLGGGVGAGGICFLSCCFLVVVVVVVLLIGADWWWW